MATDNQAEKSDAQLPARHRIIATFNALVLGRRRGPYSVGEIIRRAGVARSTFYDHFRNESSVLEAAISPMFGAMAATLAGQGGRDGLVGLLDHFWDHRQQLRAMLDGRDRARLEALLTDQLLQHMPGDTTIEPSDRGIRAVQITACTLATLHQWARGKYPVKPAQMADQLIATAGALIGNAAPQ